ncbi:ATP-binding protein [Mitsuaria sp. WAJ17]|uniref:sensor histidine kinase n=1 Tax=Mitsuaria sp. WAJ17 TaxID=2761452 RepID=UPI0016023A52|nr:sensor histidine kinase [Mitsuaria sp. WAJ17]MBB2487274.1 ATP-binding protein [Mitsuaria sp. WAJ17]
MGFDGLDREGLLRRRGWRLLLLLALALAAAWAWGRAEGPRAQVLAALGLALMLALMWGQVLPLWRAARELAGPDRSGEGAEAVLRHRERAAALSEALLDQAPVALWLYQEGGPPAALNGAARRWLAPGGARDADALLAQLRDEAEPASRQRSWLRVDAERGEERCLLASRPWVREGRQGWLLALLPLESALEAETLRAWRQLVQVLTHEIMNSLTPIASLARCAQELQAESGEGALEDAHDEAPCNAPRDAPCDEKAAAADLTVALEAIARRAEALSRFVADYRRISDWPAPRLEPVPLQALFERLAVLQSARWQARGGTLHFELESPGLLLQADAGQLEQALLNLLRNAEQATQALPQPQAWVQARLGRGGRLNIEVRDNGPGVPPGLERDIFLPFFSTREREPGSGARGIGLAVVRQLVHGMGGSVRLQRRAQGGACFVLSF